MGTFGRVLECCHSKTKERVAIKVVRRIRKYTESAAIEADILQDVNKASQANDTSLCVKLFGSFEFEGPCARRHTCIAAQPVLNVRLARDCACAGATMAHQDTSVSYLSL